MERDIESPPPRRAGDVLADTTAMNPDTFVDQTIIAVRFKETASFGMMAVVEVYNADAEDPDGETVEFHTTSHVLVDQLQELVTKDAIPIIATVVSHQGESGRPYYKLE